MTPQSFFSKTFSFAPKISQKEINENKRKQSQNNVRLLRANLI